MSFTQSLEMSINHFPIYNPFQRRQYYKSNACSSFAVEGLNNGEREQEREKTGFVRSSISLPFFKLDELNLNQKSESFAFFISIP
jgi:hypothetical protein